MKGVSQQSGGRAGAKEGSRRLSATERKRLAALEIHVRRGLRGTIEAARALRAIKEGELYRKTHTSFPAYARDRFELEKSQVYNLLNAGEVVEALSTVVEADLLPATERQARELHPILKTEGKDKLRAFWKKLVCESGAPVPSKELRRAVKTQREKSRPKLIPLPKKARSKTGEIYELGPHRLLCGDASDLEPLKRLLGKACPEVLWTDPPYGVDYKAGDPKRKIANDTIKEMRKLLPKALANADAVLSAEARFYIAAPSGNQQTDFRIAIRGVGWHLSQELVWVKDRFTVAGGDYQPQHESFLYGRLPGLKGGSRFHGGANSRWYGPDNATTVFHFPRPRASAAHPTMKPPELIEAMLRNSATEGDAVLDLFAGSGSTLEACQRLGLVAYLVELDPRYCDVIRDRWMQFCQSAGARPLPARSHRRDGS